MKKHILAMISLTLTLVMIFMSLPIEAIAYGLSQSSGDITVESPENGLSALDTLNVEYEDKSKRSSKEKHFKLSDGSYIAIQYDEPVHYYDENDGWLDIDNTLVYDSLANFNGYINESNSFEVKFADDTNSDLLYSITDAAGNNELTFELIDNTYNSEAVIIEDASTMSLTTEERSNNIIDNILPSNNLSSDIMYENVYNNVDIHYSVTPTGIKENIIVYEKLDSYEFSFNVTAGEMSLIINADGGIDVISNEEIIYTIPAPFMYDDNGRESNAVHYVLTNNTNGEYTLKIVANTQWINSDDTVFPVTIDPIINTTPNDYYTITDTYVTSAEPDTNKSTNPTNQVGLKTEGDVGRIFFNINYLPELNDCDIVTSAELCYFVAQQSRNSSISYGLHKINEEWDVSTITWNNQPEYDSEIIDTIPIDTVNGFAKWDITAFAKDYYKTGELNGLAVVSSNEATEGYALLLNNIVGDDFKPYIAVRYRCQQGIEDNYNYTTYEDGQGGIAYINNYTGTMTYIKNLITSESDVMPAHLDLVYNSSMGNSMFSSTNSYVNTCSYGWMRLSEGWKLSVQESIVPVAILEDELDTSEHTYAYIYSDEDGTEHYFYLDTENTDETVYIDEFGIGMELRYDEINNQYILKTASNTTKTFKIIRESRWDESHDNGYIVSEVDEDGNTITYSYSETYPTQLTSISDPSGTVITISYTDGFVTSVTTSGKTITFAYNWGWGNRYTTIKSISDNYGRKTSFSYKSQTETNTNTNTSGALAYVNNNDSSGLAFSYEYSSYRESSYRVTNVSYRTGEGGGVGASLYLYDLGYATTIHEIGYDCIENTDDDIYYTYTFDKAGNTKLMYAENNDRDVVYSTSLFGYKSGNALNLTDIDFKLTSYADTGIIGNNLISDSSAENATLSMSIYGDSTAISTVSNFSYSGSKSFLSSNNSTNDFGMSTAKSLAAGKYTFSAYVKAVTTTTITNHFLRVLDSNGDTIAESTPIVAINELNGGWIRLSVDFEAEALGEYTLVVAAKGTGANCFVADALQLEVDTGYTPSSYNMLENAGFENGFSNWTVSETTDNISINNSSKFDTSGVTIIGNFAKDYKISQKAIINCIPSNSYIISGWAKGNAVSTEKGDKAFDLIATVNYDYQTAEGVLLSDSLTTYIPFTWETREWQYVSGVVEMPENTEEQTITNIKNIEVGIRYKNCNSVQFDNISLVQDSALTIDYDENGNATNITVDNTSSYTYEYDDNDNLVKILDKNGAQYRRYEYNDNGDVTAEYDENNELLNQYTYDSDNNLISVTDKDGNTVESYTYTNGKLTSSNVDGKLSSYGYTSWGTQNSQSVSTTVDDVLKTISYTANYDAVTKKLTSETDSLGNTTTYGYDANMWLNLVENANGTQTRYTYTGNNITCQYVDLDKDGICDEGEAAVDFTYDTYGELTGITTATTSYAFTYNTANLLDSVSVVGESTPLITYLYNEKYTVNTGYSYANGLTVIYEYDTIGNVTGILKNNELVCSYEYDSNLKLVKETNHEINTITEYLYTDASELYLTRKTCGTDIILSYSLTDEETGKTEHITEINGHKLTYSSVYDEENDMSTYILPTLAEITTDEDEFGRAKHIYLKDSEGNSILTCTYTYVDKTIDVKVHTSEYVASMSMGGKTYSYTYDAIGNIISVSDGPYVTTYSYDELGQLLRENNQRSGKTWAYAYDTSGNILSKSEYPYTSPNTALGTPTDTITYTYSAGNWGDQLSSYDGTNITYDAIGNPLNWRDDMSFSWTGKQLNSITKGDETVSFTYDENGMRSRKTYGEDTYDYIWQDGKLIAESYCEGFDVQYYLYDENDAPVAWSYLDEYYYYIKNQQGDILGFTDDQGNVLVTYEYDAWGKLIDTKIYTNKSYLAEYNSLRYRGYLYDVQTGLYYLQSRYYDPEVGRFLNADSVGYLGYSGTVLSYNLYSYCENSVNTKTDSTGYAIDVVFDIASAAYSLFQLVSAPSWLNFIYFAWDLVSALVPFVPGSYVAKGAKIGIQVADKIGDLTKNTRFLTGSYNKLKKLFKGVKNIEIHHLVEKRFSSLFRGINVNDYLSIPLSKQLHQTITSRWRKAIPYGTNYAKLSKSKLRNAINEVYYDMPWLKKEVLAWFERNWKK